MSPITPGLHSESPPPESKSLLRLERIRTRPDFLRAQRGLRQGSKALGLETCPTPDALAKDGTVRLGFTASRKVGGAVQRNRAKRRLRAAAASILPLYGRERRDYVLIARTATLSRPFAQLLKDLTQALDGAHAAMDRAAHEVAKHAAPDTEGTKQ